MKTLNINIVKATKDQCVIKIFNFGASPNHCHKLIFNSYAELIRALKRLRIKRRTREKDCLTGYVWQYENENITFLN